MTKLHIDKFIGSEHEKSYTVPGFAIDLADRLLPRGAVESLAEKGIDIVAIAEARRVGRPYSRSVDVVERGVAKKVFVSLDR